MAELRSQDRRAIPQLIKVIGPVLHHADTFLPVLTTRICPTDGIAVRMAS